MAIDTHIAGALRVLALHGFSLSTLILSITQSSNFPNEIRHLQDHLPTILSSLHSHPQLRDNVVQWTGQVHTKHMVESIKALTETSNGWHFGATSVSGKKLAGFQVEELAAGMVANAPELCRLVSSLLSLAPPSTTPDITGQSDTGEDGHGDDELLVAARDGDAEQLTKEDTRNQQRMTIIRIKMVLIISIMMQSMNQKCNAFQSNFGIFLHSCNTPERVINTLSRLGVSVSVSAINQAVRSLSRETVQTLRSMGQSLLVGYAYDNFDIDFKTRLPTVEKFSDTLTHMTSGTLIRLEHGVTHEDLRCSEYLWTRSHLNPYIPPTIRQPMTSSVYLRLHKILTCQCNG